MIRRFFGKKRRPRAEASIPTTGARDEDETIYINLSGTEEEASGAVRLELPTESVEAETPASPFARNRGDETTIMGASDFDSTLSNSSRPAAGTKRCAAWLCIRSGDGRDRAFSISPGRNKVGRGSGNQVCLDIGDSMISQDGHVVVVADPKTKKFHVTPGDSTNLAYLNEQPILQPAELADRDILQLGKTELVFIQYYGNYVDWD